MKKNVLYLECRGCYFWENDPITKISDVGNYRIGSYDYSIPGKDGINYILEFGYYDRHESRTTNKRTGKPLKKPLYELVLPGALHINTQHENEKGCWRNCALEKQIHDKKLTYTKANILKVVNEISTKQFDHIILVSAEEIVPKLNHIYNIGGYRERAILDDLTEIKTKEYNKNYWVFTFYDSNGNTFDYELNSNRITG